MSPDVYVLPERSTIVIVLVVDAEAVVTGRGSDWLVYVLITAVTTTEYNVPAVNPSNVADLDATPSSAEGVAATPFSVYV